MRSGKGGFLTVGELRRLLLASGDDPIAHPDRATRLIRLQDGRVLVATGEHPLYDPEARAYRPAAEIRPGDRLAVVGASLGPVRVSSIEAGPTRRVLDLSIEGPHHNFVAGGVLVHNKYQPAPPKSRTNPRAEA